MAERGIDAIGIDGAEPDDESELAITADYRPPQTVLRGLWLRVRYAEGRRGNAPEDRRSLRVILNYDLIAL